MKESKNTINDDLKDKIKGGLIGFMVGDALGLPVSGLTAAIAKKQVGYIRKFTTNINHPFFYFLKKGQYGSNARLLIETTKKLVENNRYIHTEIAKTLTNIAKKSRKDFFYSRWLGVTISKALLSGKPSNSYSATCIFPTIPIAFFSNNLDDALLLSEKQSRITHMSTYSLAASCFVAYLLFSLKSGRTDIHKISQEGLNNICKIHKGIKQFTNKINLILSGKVKSVIEARKLFGTGSHVDQFIPLALYIFLKYSRNFEKAVILAANSYRVEKAINRNKYLNLSKAQELIKAIGGSTDGTAGLVGCMIGALNGYSAIPNKFLQDLEDHKVVVNLINRYFSL